MSEEIYILPFSKISKEDVDKAGGKGASLGEMIKIKIPVPPGFVILASAFQRFIYENDIEVEIDKWIKKVDPKSIESVEEASGVLRHIIKESPMPKNLEEEIVNKFKKLKSPLVAVRSSATAEDSKIDSWAGELESYLNTNKKTLLQNVRNCWASLFTPRAIFYRLERNMGGKKVLVAVVVQKMVQSEISGICFTVHPVTKDEKQLIIEAGWGLGEAIVSGQITPDSYVIDKRDFSILDINIANQEKMIVKAASGNKWVTVPKNDQEKQKLTGKQIIEFSELAAGIEKHYKSPQDIEWALEKGKFYVVQSRPITTL